MPRMELEPHPIPTLVDITSRFIAKDITVDTQRKLFTIPEECMQLVNNHVPVNILLRVFKCAKCYENGKHTCDVIRKKDGILKHIRYREDDQIASITYERDGKREGKCKTWYSNGSYHEDNYQNGERNGIYKRLRSDLTLHIVGNHMNGRDHGKRITYRKNGAKRKVEWHAYGNNHGKYKAWYKNGNIRLSCNYWHGQLHGEYREWYENGQIKVHCSYKHTKRHGEYRKWHENGTLRIQATYKHGLLFGSYKRWSMSGDIDTDEMHVADVML